MWNKSSGSSPKIVGLGPSDSLAKKFIKGPVLPKTIIRRKKIRLRPVKIPRISL